MKKIPLTQNKFALVDAEDYPVVSRYKWHAVKIANKWYAATELGGKPMYLHRFVTGTKSRNVIDHIDGNGLNCQKENMRQCTQKQNLANRSGNANNPAGFKGVVRTKRKKHPFAANIQGKHIGMFPTAVDAAKAYDEKAREVYGEFARTNF